jgi:hypothetical protein
MGVHVLDLRTGQRRVLLEDVVTASYLPTGHLLYVRRDGAALAAPFDLDRLEITGATVPVLEGVFVTTGTAQLAWSPAGALVYLGGTGTAAEREFVRVGRDGAPVPIDTAWHGAYNSFALAADGRRLAVGTGLTSGALGIWVKQLDRGPFTRLTFGGQDRRPAWSPDGRIVAFVRDSGNHSAVFARPADGSGADRMLARLDRAIQEITWSPDGRWVVVRTDNGGAGAGDLVGVRTSGDTTPVPLAASEFTELHPAVSPTAAGSYSSNESARTRSVRPFPAHWRALAGLERGRLPWSPTGGSCSSRVPTAPWSPRRCVPPRRSR